MYFFAAHFLPLNLRVGKSETLIKLTCLLSISCSLSPSVVFNVFLPSVFYLNVRIHCSSLILLFLIKLLFFTSAVHFRDCPAIKRKEKLSVRPMREWDIVFFHFELYDGVALYR